MRLCLVFGALIVSFLSSRTTRAQVFSGDTLRQKPRPVRAFTKDPDKSLYLSLMLPGAGQVYNGDAWKVPVIVGTYATLGTYIGYNHKLYNQFRVAAQRVSDPDTETTTPFPGLSRGYLTGSIDRARRNRDILILLSVLAYFLQVADAHVTAHLRGFTINDNLSYRPDSAPPPTLPEHTLTLISYSHDLY